MSSASWPPRIGFSPSRRGFTLVELLVVIATVALLVALLLPSLHAAKLRALKVKCASNLRQIAIASITYTSDYTGHFPLVGGAFAFSDPPNNTAYQNSMWPFWSVDTTPAHNMDVVFTQAYKLQTIKMCPLRVWDHNLTVPVGFWLPTDGGTDYSYVLWEGRGYHRTDGWDEYVGPRKVEARVRKALASDIMYKCIGDGNSIGTGWFSAHADGSEIIGFNGSVPDPPSDMNIAFTDGSVLDYGPSQISQVVYAYVNWFGAGPMTAPEPP